MGKIVLRKRYVLSVAGAICVALAALATSPAWAQSSAPGKPESLTAGRHMAKEADVSAWIVANDTVGGHKGSNGAATRPPIRAATSGPTLEKLLPLAATFVPSGSTQLSAKEFPDVRAASVSYASGGVVYTLTVEKLTQPVGLQEMSIGAKASLKVLDSGSQEVTLVRPGTSIAQAILARKSGILLTVTTMNEITPSSNATPQGNTAASAPISAESLTARVASKLDTESLDQVTG